MPEAKTCHYNLMEMGGNCTVSPSYQCTACLCTLFFCIEKINLTFFKIIFEYQDITK